MKIAVVGMGYVGLSLAILLAQNNDVCALDVDENKINKLKRRESPIRDKEIEDYLANNNLRMTATTDEKSAFSDAEYIIIAVSTDYDEERNSFDVSAVDEVMKSVLKINPEGTIVIKSTVPLGYSAQVIKEHNCDRVLFSPEFLREGHALYDNLYPSRIVVGFDQDSIVLKEKAEIFAALLKNGAQKEDIPVIYTGTTEAEAIKLFSNTYLALRVAFFNELDTYAAAQKLDSKAIVEGVSLDYRIGNYYNNPSFGYGGYCLPKDTKQLKASFKDIPQELISAVIKSNCQRKNFIAQEILKMKPSVVGLYRLIMKANSDNFRHSAILGVAERLKNEGVHIIVYEPTLNETATFEYEVVQNLSEFKRLSDVIIANRYNQDIDDVLDKVYTRDLFFRD